MNSTLSDEMLRRINSVLSEARGSNKAVAVYAEAEKIRQLDPQSNIALEDIVERFISGGQSQGVAFEIDPGQAAEAVMGVAARPADGARHDR